MRWWSRVFRGVEGSSGEPVTSLLERLRSRILLQLVPLAVTAAPGTTDIKPCQWYTYVYIAFRFKEVQERCKSGSTEVSFFGQFLAKDSFRVRPLLRSRCLRAGPVNTALTGAKRNAEGRPRRMRPNGTFSSLGMEFKISAGVFSLVTVLSSWICSPQIPREWYSSKAANLSAIFRYPVPGGLAVQEHARTVDFITLTRLQEDPRRNLTVKHQFHKSFYQALSFLPFSLAAVSTNQNRSNCSQLKRTPSNSVLSLHGSAVSCLCLTGKRTWVR